MKKEKNLSNKRSPKAIDCAPQWKRFIAYMIDWYLGYIFTALPMVLIYIKVTNSENFNTNLVEYPKEYAVLAGVLGLIFALFYYVFVPLKIWKGQTLGKHWCHCKIVKLDGNDVFIKELFLRQIIGIFILESALFFPGKLIQQIVSLASNKIDLAPLIYLGIALSVLSSIFVVFRKDQRAIHDLIASTKVVNF